MRQLVAQRETLNQDDREFLLAFEDDSEELAWMVASDRHRVAIIAFLLPLQKHAATDRPDWYVSSELLVTFPKPDGSTGKVAPDVFVALAHNHQRASFDVRVEGGFPAFVLEVISPDYEKRDEEDKARIYRLQGAREYAFFNPLASDKPQLQGYCRTARGAWVRWPTGLRGELRSAVLGLTLVPDGPVLRLEDAQGNRLPTPEEVEAAHAEADAARIEAETARAEADAARIEAETARAQAEAAREDAEAARAGEAAARMKAEEARAEGEARIAALEAELARRSAGQA